METKKEISDIIYFILCLVAFRHFMNILSSIITLSDAPMGSFYNIVLGLLMIIALLLIAFKKKIGIYLFGIIQIANVIGQTIINVEDFGIHLFVALFMCALMFFILQIRKNGVSAWKVIFGKEGTDIISNENQE